MKKIVSIEGMMCNHCKAHVEEALKNLGLSYEVSLENKNAIIFCDVSNEMITKAIEDAGYEVTGIENEG